MRNEMLANPSNVSTSLTLLYIPACYPRINIRLPFTTKSSSVGSDQVSQVDLTLDKFIFQNHFDWCVCIYIYIAQSQTNNGKEHQRQEIWVLAQAFLDNSGHPLGLNVLVSSETSVFECFFQT